VVRSVQRLPRPPSMDAEAVKREYAAWLPRFLRPFIRVWFDVPAAGAAPTRMVFSLLRKRWQLLALDLASDRSAPDRQLLYITGGALTARGGRGRLELREVLQRRYVLAAIHEFKPALPWYVYRYTQAVVHLLVMRGFARHLRRIERRELRAATPSAA